MSISTRSARRGAAVLASGLLLSVVPGLVAGDAAQAAPSTDTAITITASPISPVSGGKLTLLADLSAPGKRTVTFFGQVRGQRVQKLLSVTTDANGRAVIQGNATYNSTFSVRFAGDATYKSSQSAVSLVVKAKVTTKGKGGKQKKGYRLYKKNTKATTTVKVAPSKKGKKVFLRLEKFVGGKWKLFGVVAKKLGKGSKVTASHIGKAGARYRVRAEYRGDKLNAANVSPWRYEVFKR